MFDVGIPELIVIMLIALILFGPGRLSEIGGAIGKSIKGFKKAMKEPEEIDPKSEKDREDMTSSQKP